jgi:hypothetical protein
MTDNTWRPNGTKVTVQGVPYDPFQALRNFVLPIRHVPNWIEDSKDVTNTGLSAREWFGLVLHALTLSDKTGEYVQVATENTGGDGAVVRNENGVQHAVLVEQTLATHFEKGELLEVIKRRVNAKSSRGENYALNKHLVVLCNNNGDLNEKELYPIVANGKFNIVTIIGFQENEKGRHYLCFIFDKDNPDKAIHKCAIREPELWQSAIDIYENEQKLNNS